MTHDEAVGIVERRLHAIGYKTLPRRSKNASGPDITAYSDNNVLFLEVKTVHKLKNGTFQSGPIKIERQRKDDFVAVVFNRENIFFEEMTDFLSNASRTGTRAFTRHMRLFNCGKAT